MLRYRLLGPLAVERDGIALELGAPKQRALLAVLAQEAGTSVSVDRIVHQVWSDDVPPNVAASLHANVSRLRRLLRDDPSAPPPIARRAGGYVLDAERAEFDVRLFVDGAVAAGAAADRHDWAGAEHEARQALGLWRGGYLDDLRDEPWVQVAAAPLTERRQGVRQVLIAALLGLGDVPSALARSTELFAASPLAERAAWLHVLALYRAGRTADALEAYRAFAARLDDELGLDPGADLRELHQQVLQQDPGLARWPGAAASPPEVAAVPAAPPTSVAASGAGSTLVGRRQELADALDALSAARVDGARWVVLAGPAGMGKSRLAGELADRWAADGGQVAHGRCPDLDDVPPWWPIRQVLADLGTDPDDVLTPRAGAEADSARFAVLERAAAVVTQRATTRPLLVVVDDLHWADPASLAALTLLAETATTAGLAFVVTTRQTRGTPALDRLLAAIGRRPGSRQLALAGLSADEVAELIAQTNGEPADTADAVQLTVRTGGTPFYVLEYARLPAEQRHGDRIPAAVRSVLRQRFAGLPEATLAAVQAAAVLGDPLDVQLLAAVLGRPADDVADLLDDAADADLLVPSADGTTYAFAHALLAEELGAGLPELRRRRLHLRAAHAVRAAAPDAARRARHLHAAGALSDPADAYETFRQAAATADERWLSEQAATWWAAAADAYERTPAPDADVRDDLIAAQVRAVAHAGRGQHLLDLLDAALLEALRAGRTASVGRLAANLLRVTGSWPWPVLAADFRPMLATLTGIETALGDDAGARARVLAVAAAGFSFDGDPAVMETLSRRAVELAETTGDTAVLADALFGRALTYSGVASHSQQTIDVLNRVGTLDYPGGAADDVLRRNIVTMALFDLGRMDECAEHVRAGSVGADVMRMPINRVQLRWAEAGLMHWHGDLARARELYDRAGLGHRQTELEQLNAIEVARFTLAWDAGELASLPPVADDAPVARWATVVLDAAAGRAGCDEELVAEVRRPEPDTWITHGRLTALAHAVADRGLAEVAEPLLADLQPVRGCVAAFGQAGPIGPVALAMARLARLLGDRTAARELLDEAVELATRSDGRCALVHCELEAVRWAAADGRLRPAHAAAVATEAARRGMTGIARQARAFTG